MKLVHQQKEYLERQTIKKQIEQKTKLKNLLQGFKNRWAGRSKISKFWDKWFEIMKLWEQELKNWEKVKKPKRLIGHYQVDQYTYCNSSI